MTTDVLLGVFGIANLALALGTLYISWRWKRWIVGAWAVLTVLTSLPFTFALVGFEVDSPSLVVLTGITVLRSVAVLGAAISSDGETRRMREIIERAGIDPEEPRWRP